MAKKAATKKVMTTDPSAPATTVVKKKAAKKSALPARIAATEDVEETFHQHVARMKRESEGTGIHWMKHEHLQMRENYKKREQKRIADYYAKNPDAI